MYYKIGFISFLLFSLASNTPAQVNVPDTPYCEKSIEFLKNHCYECVNYSNTKKCKVEKFDFLGKANDNYYYYGAYLTEPFHLDYKFYHFIIYERNSDKSYLKPVNFFYPRFGGYTYYDVKMNKTKFGDIIHIHLVDKDAGWDDGEYIIYRNGKWEHIRVPNWSCAAESLLPEDYSLDFQSSNPWIKIDLDSMSIKIPLDDERYQPTGGFVIFNLVIEKDRFSIVNSKYIPGTGKENKIPQTNAELFSYCKKSIDFLRNNCYSCEDSSENVNCKFMEFGSIGDYNGKQYYYGLYSKLNGKDNDISYFTIYEGICGNDSLKPIHFEFFESKPSYDFEIVNTKYGLIIHIALIYGTGSWDDGDYIIYNKGKWEKLKIPDWNCVYEWIIPEYSWFCRGNIIDLNAMTNTFSVYSYDNGCCCPTGIVTSELAVDENGFRVFNSKYYPNLKE